MLKLAFCLSIFLTLNSHSSDCISQRSFGESKDQLRPFCYIKTLNGYINKKFLDIDSKILDLVNQKKSQKFPKAKNGQNPGAVICNSLNGRVVIYIDEFNDQNSFCRAEDGSEISVTAFN